LWKFLTNHDFYFQRKNAELCSKIHEERMICLDVKVQIRMIQQKQLENSLSIQAILGWMI
jgi:RalA-binding protein 1